MNERWTDIPREDWRAYQDRKVPPPDSKVVRDFLRWNEEYWAMQECRAVGMKRTMVYR